MYVTDSYHTHPLTSVRTGHTLRVSCLSVAPDGSALATASWDSLIKVRVCV